MPCSDVNLKSEWVYHTCEIKFSSWSYPGGELALQRYGEEDEVSMEAYDPNCPLEASIALIFITVFLYE